MKAFIYTETLANQQYIEQFFQDLAFFNYELVSHADFLVERIRKDRFLENTLLIFRTSKVNDSLVLACKNSFLRTVIAVDCDQCIQEIDESIKCAKLSDCLNLMGFSNKQYLRDKEDRNKPFLLRVNNKMRVIEKNEIAFIKSEGKYASIHFNSKKILVRQTLKSILLVLPNQFCRVHASYIVNVERIAHMKPQDSQLLIDGHFVPYSRKFKDDLLSYFSVH